MVENKFDILIRKLLPWPLELVTNIHPETTSKTGKGSQKRKLHQLPSIKFQELYWLLVSGYRYLSTFPNLRGTLHRTSLEPQPENAVKRGEHRKAPMPRTMAAGTPAVEAPVEAPGEEG